LPNPFYQHLTSIFTFTTGLFVRVAPSGLTLDGRAKDIGASVGRANLKAEI
jgi:hypothetical protein